VRNIFSSLLLQDCVTVQCPSLQPPEWVRLQPRRIGPQHCLTNSRRKPSKCSLSSAWKCSVRSASKCSRGSCSNSCRRQHFDELQWQHFQALRREHSLTTLTLWSLSSLSNTPSQSRAKRTTLIVCIRARAPEVPPCVVILPKTLTMTSSQPVFQVHPCVFSNFCDRLWFKLRIFDE
jgi:hypothetical protein